MNFIILKMSETLTENTKKKRGMQIEKIFIAYDNIDNHRFNSYRMRKLII